MKTKNIKLKTLLGSITLAGMIAPVLSIASCASKEKEPIVTEYFEIEGTVLKGFKKGLTEKQKKDACPGGVLTIPKGITTIAASAFDAEQDRQAPVTNIVIPATTTNVERRAFYGNTAETIMWEGGYNHPVEKIGQSAFAFCKSLKSFLIPTKLFEAVQTKNDVRIDKGAFFNCKTLAELDLRGYPYKSGEAFTKPAWEMGAFSGLAQNGNMIFKTTTDTKEKLTYASVWSNLIWNGVESAWKECEEISGEVKPWTTQIKCVPEQWLNITDNKLISSNEELWPVDNTDFNAVIVPANVTALDDSINTNLFAKRKSVAYWDFHSCSLTAINANAFKVLAVTEAVPVVEIYFKKGITTIGESAFEGCQWTPYFDDTTTITSFGGNAFKNCETITDITFNATPTLAAGAFAGAKKLQKLDVTKWATIPTIPENVFDAYTGSSAETRTLKVPTHEKKIEQWKNNRDIAAALSGGGLDVSDTGWVINPKATLDSWTDVYDVDETNKVIKGWAKVNDKELTETEIIAALTDLGSLYKDNTLVLPSGYSVADGAFYSATTNTSKIPSAIKKLDIQSTSVGANAFNGATSITNIKFSTNLTQIGDSAFAGLTVLTTIDISAFDYAKAQSLDGKVAANAFTGSLSVEGLSISNKQYINPIDQYRHNHALTKAFTLFDETKFTYVADKSKVSLVKGDDEGVIDGFAVGKETGATPLTDAEIVSLATALYGTPTLVIPAKITNSSGAQISVTGIKTKAFVKEVTQTNSLKSTVPDGITKIEFASGCTCASIGAHAFYDCHYGSANGVTVDFTNATALTTIGDNAFSGAKIVGKVSLPASLTSIGEAAFYETEMTELAFANFTKISLGDGCFAQNAKLATIDMSALAAVPTEGAEGWTIGACILNGVAEAGTIKIKSGVTGMKAFLQQHSNMISYHASAWKEQE